MKSQSSYWPFVGIGFELVGIQVAMLYIGYQFDQWLNLPGVGLIVLSLAGLISWFYRVILLLRRVEKEDENSE